MNPTNHRQQIDLLIRARYPLVALETHEETRLLTMLADIADLQHKKILCWSTSYGIYRGTTYNKQKIISPQTVDPQAALETVLEFTDPALFVFLDFHPYLKDPAIVRRLREVGRELRQSHKTVFFVSPVFPVPCDLEKEITVVNISLPNIDELSEMLRRIEQDLRGESGFELNMTVELREKLLKAMRGLTVEEAENVLAKVLVQHKGFKEDGLDTIIEEKEHIIQRSGMLEYYHTQESFNDIGGLEYLKVWLDKRYLAFSEKAKEFGLPFPKGALLIGVQGCGKSLCAKAVARRWNVPILRMDMGKIFSSLVGSSEANISQAINLAEAIAPAVLWIDEIEKAFAGLQSSEYSDAGTTARVFGSFLTWMNEKTSPVFVISTANDISALPPEMLRKGRFDEIFFVDLPNMATRAKIFKIHIEKRGHSVDNLNLAQLAKVTTGFSGAEIEEVVIAALFDAFEQEKPLEQAMLLRNIKATVPLSRTMKEKLQKLHEWALGRARPAAPSDKHIAKKSTKPDLAVKKGE